MADMTLDEAVRYLAPPYIRAETSGEAFVELPLWVYLHLRAHATRTIAAREGADEVHTCACGEQWSGDGWHDPECEVYAHFLALHARLADAEAARDAAQAEARQTSIDTTAPLYNQFLAMRKERDEARRERDEAVFELDSWREHEAACCPEDVGFDEWIAALTRQRDVARLERDQYMQPFKNVAAIKSHLREELDTARAELAAMREKLLTAPVFSHPKAGQVIRAADVHAAVNGETDG